MRAILTGAALVSVAAVPMGLAALSPLLAWRDPIYIAAGFAGIAAMVALFAQPLLMAGDVPGVATPRARQAHRWVGAALVLLVVVHVVALWITSPPDVIDVLLFASPTPFSIWGVVAMWAVFAAGLMAWLRRRLPLRPRRWRVAHTGLAAITVVGSAGHALLIEGTMEPISKAVLCALVLAATIRVMVIRRVWAGLR